MSTSAAAAATTPNSPPSRIPPPSNVPLENATDDEFPPPPSFPAANGDDDDGQRPQGEEQTGEAEDASLVPGEPEEEEEEKNVAPPVSPPKPLQVPNHIKTKVPEKDAVDLKDALFVHADALKLRSNGYGRSADADVVSKIIAFTMLSKPLLQGVKWFVDMIDQIKDENVKSEIVNDSNLWKAVLKIALRDPLVSSKPMDPNLRVPTWPQIAEALFYSQAGRKGLRLVSEKRERKEKSKIVSNPSSPPPPSSSSSSNYGEYAEEGDYVTDGTSSFKIDSNNGYYYYVRHLLMMHKEDMSSAYGRRSKTFCELDLSYLTVDPSSIFAEELYHLCPVWSHGDAYSEHVCGDVSNTGAGEDGGCTIAYKGRHFKRFDYYNGRDMFGCPDFIPPLECDFFAPCAGTDADPSERSMLQSSISRKIGTEPLNAAYEKKWNSCVAFAGCARHIKERLENAKHSSLYSRYLSGKKLKTRVPKKPMEPSKFNKKGYYQNGSGPGGRMPPPPPQKKDACEELCDYDEVWKPVLDALYDESAVDSKKTIANFHVLGDGSVLCIFEDNPLPMIKEHAPKTGGRLGYIPVITPEPPSGGQFCVLPSFANRTPSSTSAAMSVPPPSANPRTNLSGPLPPPVIQDDFYDGAKDPGLFPLDFSLSDRSFTVVHYKPKGDDCKCTVLGRFKYSDLKKTRNFLNGKPGSPYGVSFKRGASCDKQKKWTEFGTYGDCKEDRNYELYTEDEKKRTIKRKMASGKWKKPMRGDERWGVSDQGKKFVKTRLVNSILFAKTFDCKLKKKKGGPSSEGKALSVDILLDKVALAPSGEDYGVQDEILSMTFYYKTKPKSASETGASSSLFFKMKGVVATNINREHFGGRAPKRKAKYFPNEDDAMRDANGNPAAIPELQGPWIPLKGKSLWFYEENGKFGRSVYKRGFNVKGTKTNVQDVQKNPMKGSACICKTLVLSDASKNEIGGAHVISWSEPYFQCVLRGDLKNWKRKSEAIAAASSSAMIMKGGGAACVINRPKGARPPSSSPSPPSASTAPPAGREAPLAMVKPDSMRSPFKRKTEIVSHDHVFVSHIIDGPFSRRNPSYVMGFIHKAETATYPDGTSAKKIVPWSVIHKADKKVWRKPPSKNDVVGLLDKAIGFNIFQPSDSFVMFENDYPSGFNDGNENGDVSEEKKRKGWYETIGGPFFHPDKTWLDGSNAVAIVPDPTSGKSVAKVFSLGDGRKGISPANRKGVAKPSSEEGATFDFEVVDAEPFYMLNASFLGGKRSYDETNFYGPSKGKLGGLFRPSEEILVFLLKEDFESAKSRLFRKISRASQRAENLSAPSSSSSSSVGGTYATNGSKFSKTVDPKPTLVGRIYVASWTKETTDPWGENPVPNKEEGSFQNGPACVIVRPSGGGSGGSSGMSIGNEVLKAIYNDSISSKVCASPSCLETRCSFSETKGENFKLHFCGLNCQKQYYDAVGKKGAFKKMFGDEKPRVRGK